MAAFYWKGSRIDFTGLSVVSSSFADELLGKLIAKMGLATFNQRCQLIGMNSTIRAIVDRSIQQRIQATDEKAHQIYVVTQPSWWPIFLISTAASARRMW